MEYPKGRKKIVKEKAYRQGCSEGTAERRALISWTSYAKKELRANATPSELAFMSKLLDAGFYKHDFQKSFYLNDKVCIADFFIRKPHKIAIEIDGGYHFTKVQLAKDLIKDKIMLGDKQVNSVLRLTDAQAHNISIQELSKVLRTMKKGEVTCLYNR